MRRRLRADHGDEQQFDKTPACGGAACAREVHACPHGGGIVDFPRILCDLIDVRSWPLDIEAAGASILHVSVGND
jgi:hypothetical protein